MGIHYNHKSKAGDRKMEKELKRKMKIESMKIATCGSVIYFPFPNASFRLCSSCCCL